MANPAGTPSHASPAWPTLLLRDCHHIYSRRRTHPAVGDRSPPPSRCWPESKYGAVSGTQWKWKSGASRFSHVVKALV